MKYADRVSEMINAFSPEPLGENHPDTKENDRALLELHKIQGKQQKNTGIKPGS